MQQIIHNCES